MLVLTDDSGSTVIRNLSSRDERVELIEIEEEEKFSKTWLPKRGSANSLFL